jgi:hypothetical protein
MIQGMIEIDATSNNSKQQRARKQRDLPLLDRGSLPALARWFKPGPFYLAKAT